MIYGSDIKKFLVSKMDATDPAESSHWRQWSKSLELDSDLNIVSAKGFGDGRKPYSHFTRPFHKLLQSRYTKKTINKEAFNRLYSLAVEKCKVNDIRFSLDTLRQVMTLAHLKTYIEGDTDAHTSIVIGDGYGALTHLLIASGVSKKVILVSVSRVLIVDNQCLLSCPEFCGAKTVCLVENERDMLSAIEDPETKVVLLEARNSELLRLSNASMAFAIASMQEMNYSDINLYFSQIRFLASTRRFLFYCCSREKKTLPDGQIIEFDKYPWSTRDKILLDEPCPWHDKYYRSILPIYFKYDGVHRHKLIEVAPEK